MAGANGCASSSQLTDARANFGGMRTRNGGVGGLPAGCDVMDSDVVSGASQTEASHDGTSSVRRG